MGIDTYYYHQESYQNNWIQYRKELTRLEMAGEGKSKIAQSIRNKMISYWNKMKPQQQREIANQFSES